jgi:hypothetical protein
MSEAAENLVILTLAKGSTAELRSLIERCNDRETGRVLYTELRNLAHKLAVKHKFPAEIGCKEREAA